MGFKELPHTADVAFEVWAPDFISLLGEAALGLNQVAGVELDPNAPVSRNIELEEMDRESLLVAFLTELVYAQEQDQLAFDQFHLTLDGRRLAGRLAGGRIRSLVKPIKAVTFHNIEVTESAGELRVQIVLDV